jgi:hypothetical protein
VVVVVEEEGVVGAPEPQVGRAEVGQGDAGPGAVTEFPVDRQ